MDTEEYDIEFAGVETYDDDDTDFDDEEFAIEDDYLVIHDSEGEVTKIVSPKKKKAQTCCKKCMITLSVIIANMAYLAIGGWLFNIAESSHAKKTIHNIKEFQKDTCERFSTVYKFKGDDVKPLIFEVIDNFTRDIHRYLEESKWDGNLDESKTAWTYPDALLYSLVVITTIGYGDITPLSKNGRALTVSYAMIGIPLFLIMVNAAGEKLGRGFKYMYWYASCRPWREKRKAKKVQKSMRLLVMGLQTKEQREAKIWKLSDLCVPIRVSVIVFAVYLMIGAIPFWLIESNWDLVVSMYVSFTTLTTIGFGDYVFGKCRPEQDCERNELKIFGSCFYIIFGLGVVSMCFNHMTQTFQDNFFNGIRQKLGISKRRDKEEEDEDPVESEPEKSIASSRISGETYADDEHLLD